jgi:methyl-accepting chemotaxis protein
MILSKTLFTLIFLLPGILFFIQVYKKKKRFLIMKSGGELIHAFRKLLEHIPLHRGAANAFLNGDGSFEDKMMSMQHNITSDIQNIDNYINQHNVPQKVCDDWNAIKTSWQQLATEVKKLDANESFERHSSIISNIIYLISDISDEMGVSSHPKTSIARIIQTTFNILPPMIELAGQARGIGTGAIAKGKLITAVRIKLEFLIKQLGESIANVHKNMEANLNEESRHYIDRQLLIETESHNQALIKAINKNLMGVEITISATDYFAVGSNAFDANIKLLDKIIGTFIKDIEATTAGLNSTLLLPIVVYTGIVILFISWWL